MERGAHRTVGLQKVSFLTVSWQCDACSSSFVHDVNLKNYSGHILEIFLSSEKAFFFFAININDLCVPEKQTRQLNFLRSCENERTVAEISLLTYF